MALREAGSYLPPQPVGSAEQTAIAPAPKWIQDQLRSTGVVCYSMPKGTRYVYGADLRSSLTEFISHEESSDNDEVITRIPTMWDTSERKLGEDEDSFALAHPSDPLQPRLVYIADGGRGIFVTKHVEHPQQLAS